MSASNETPIAIVGIGCRFPGGVHSPAGLWNLLAEGRDTVSVVPADRWDAARLMAFQDPDEAVRYGRGCFLDGDVWAWDPEALSVAPSEQRWIDPQFRVLMEVAWEAVEHAGVPIDRVRGSRTGVFAGVYAPDNLLREARPVEDALDSAYMFGNFTGTMVGRLAFGMDLRGPVMAINTMCSSGLVAVDTACAALTLGECDLALAGAVLLMLSPEIHHYEASLLTSQRGRCFAFDERADGYVRGEGAGIVVLKRLVDALRDRDRVLAVVRGSAVNNDGQATRLTAPSTLVQQELFRAAVSRAEIDPGDVGLVETHGPGTAVGDPIEYASIDAVYGHGRGRCAMGSVKTNLGHSEPASGIAGMIKAVECLRHGMIPANLNFGAWNPAITRRPDSRLFVPTSMTPWPVLGDPRLAAVCSYGVTGTNAHLILEQSPSIRRMPAPRRPAAARPAGSAKVFPLSAASSEGVALAAARLADWAEGDGARTGLSDLAHTLAVRRQHSAYRVGVVARTHQELAVRARAFAAGSDVDGVAAGTPMLPVEHAGPVLVFTGQGSQWPGMCQGLLDVEPVFTAAVDEMEPLIAAESGFSLRQMIIAPRHLVGVERIQPTLFGIQVALAALWRSWGLRPAAVIGQSLGEVAAAVVAGALCLADGVAVICRRATLLAETAGGAMASVLLPVERVERDIDAAGAGGVSIGVITSPEATVISGDATQVAALVAGWQAADIVARMVEVDVASHSAQMDPILGRLHAVLTGLTPIEPGMRFYSTVTGRADDVGTVSGLLDGDYWVANQRSTVQFQVATSVALRDGHRLFLECAPHPVAVRAITAIARHTRTAGVVAVGSLRRDTDDHDAHLTQVAAVHCAGANVDWESRYGGGNLVDAPVTAWRRSRHGGDDPPYRLVAPGLVGAEQHPLLGGYLHDPDQRGRHLWQTPIGPDRLPWLGDHRVAGVPVLPGTGFAEMMLAAATRVFATDQVAVADLILDSPLVLEPEPTVTTRLVSEGDTARVEVLSDTETGPLIHAHAKVYPLLGNNSPHSADIAGQDSANWQEMVPDELYRHFRDRHDIHHGPAFAGLERIRLHPEADRALVSLRIAASGRVSAWMMALHPALADELVQSVVSVWINRYATSPGPVVVAGFDAIRVYGPTAHARRAEVWLRHADDRTCVASGKLTTIEGAVVAEIEGLRLINVTPPAERFAACLSHLAWVPSPATAEPANSAWGRWLVIGEADDPWPDRVAKAIDARSTGCLLASVPTGGKLPLTRLADILAEPAESPWAGVIVTVTDHHVGTQPHLVARARVALVAAVIRMVADLPALPRLWIATHASEPSLSSAGLRGLLRVAAFEHPGLAPSMIDLDTDTTVDRLVDDLLDGDEQITEIAWRHGQRFTARVCPGPAARTASREEQPPVRPGAAYLVTGGLGGLGLLTVAWLAERGAGHLVLCARSAPTPRAERVLADARSSGSRVTVVCGDIADPAVAEHAVAVANGGGMRLRGVIHAAGVVEDATLATLDHAMLERVWRGKAEGAWVLHHATAGHDLDFWVAYSSVASQLGSPGQAAYAAGNAFLDDLVAWRAAKGLPATGIQWGAWSEIGRGQHLAERGFAMINPVDGIDALERILTTGHTQIAYSPIDLARWIAPYPALARSTLFTDLLADHHDDEQQSSTVLQDLLSAETDSHRKVLIEAHIIECVRDILGGTTRHITPATSLVMLGVDSLAAVQLQNHLQRTLKITIESGVIWVKPTAAGLGDWIMGRMGFLAGGAATVTEVVHQRDPLRN